MRQLLVLLLLLICTTPPNDVHAQATLVSDDVTLQKAKVISVSNEYVDIVPGTQAPEHVQTLTVSISDGDNAGKTISFKNDYIQLATGDIFYLRHVTNSLDSRDMWSVATPYRLNILGILGLIFLVLIIWVGGLQGARGLASLVASIALIFVLLIPGMLHDYSPVLVAGVVAGTIIVLGSYITHGFNRTTSAAVLGMLATVAITGALGWWAVHAAQLSGFNSEESTYLNLNTAGGIDLVGLLFGGILIGLLGVLYDIAIGQAISVEELYRARAERSHVYSRALRIGREHIGALVNTLAIAYVGASLPLLLLLIQTSAGSDIGFILNNEIFSTEIIRILIGSIGLVLAVPITTIIAVHLLDGQVPEQASGHAHHH